MRKFRGIIALVISVILGLIAAKAVYWYLNRPKPQKVPPHIVAAKPPEPIKLSQRIPKGMRLVSVKLDDLSVLPGEICKGDLVDVLATSRIPQKEGATLTRIVLQGVEVYTTREEGELSSKKLVQRQGDRTVSLLLRPDQAVTLIAASESAKIRMMARNPMDAEQSFHFTTAYSHDTGVEKVDEAALQVSFHPKPGMRAITLKVQDTDGVLGVLRPGDRVDVIVTCPYSLLSAKGRGDPGDEGRVTETRLVSKTLLQDVEVLATEQVLGLSVGKEDAVQRVTLSVTPALAEKLAVISDATKKSIIRLLSRHPDDHDRSISAGVKLIDVLAEQKEYLQVDIYKGGKESYRTFYR